MSDWHNIASETIRLSVPGGWLYAVGHVMGDGRYRTVVVKQPLGFVPIPPGWREVNPNENAP